ncbi:hypothetical protein BDC45DRAFT_576421 [Circinella umbellata]|nr:hypothetical protein BDC45DRAFT_576421 [Circinella umbellata]
METLEKVEEHVLEFPVEKPYGLKVGTSPICVQKPVRPISDINPDLRNLAVLESAYMELADLTNEFQGYLQSADITPGKMCITFCVPDIAMKADFKKHPMLTNVTYDCFIKGYYLCTTNIYSEEIDKFGVIFQGVLDRLSTMHFKNYFLSFFKTFDFVFGHADEVIDMNFSGLWLNWWVHEEIAGMIFRSKQWLKDELQAHPTRTTSDFDHIKNGGRADY